MDGLDAVRGQEETAWRAKGRLEAQESEESDRVRSGHGTASDPVARRDRGRDHPLLVLRRRVREIGQRIAAGARARLPQ